MSEMEVCTNQAINSPEEDTSDSESDFFDKLVEITENNSSNNNFAKKLLSYSKFTEECSPRHILLSQSSFQYCGKHGIEELIPLTGNPNYLHRPSVDDDFLVEFPHKTLKRPNNTFNKMEVLTGITSDEAFYFLENDYDFNEIIKHTFIYSSLLNLTTNLLEKLTVIDRDLGKLKIFTIELVSFQIF